MDPEVYKNSPLRKPGWRADRALQMVEHQPLPLRPRYYDDCYVRTYRRCLLSFIIAGDDEVALLGLMREMRQLFHAHALRFNRARERRDVPEAGLLPPKPLSEIANRLG